MASYSILGMVERPFTLEHHPNLTTRLLSLKIFLFSFWYYFCQNFQLKFGLLLRSSSLLMRHVYKKKKFIYKSTIMSMDKCRIHLSKPKKYRFKSGKNLYKFNIRAIQKKFCPKFRDLLLCQW